MQTCLNRLPTISRRNEPRNGTMIPSFASWTTGLPSRMRDRNCNPASKTCAARDPRSTRPIHATFGLQVASASSTRRRCRAMGPLVPSNPATGVDACARYFRSRGRCDAAPGRRRGQGFVAGGCSDAARFSRFCGLTWIRPQRGLSMSAIRKNEIERMKGMTIRSRRSRSNVFEV